MTANEPMNDVIAAIRHELLSSADEATRLSGLTFFKEQVQLYGVKTAVGEKIAKKYFKEVEGRGKAAIFALCDQLWRSGYMEEGFIACNWAYALRKYYEPDDFAIFERWLHENVGNWAACDTLCNHTIGAFIELYPEYLPKLEGWATSANRWVRRGAAVSLIVPARHGEFLPEVFRIADILLEDEDDLVRKGYGWMLKVASQAHQREVFDYVLANKARMPRTALRYAIEKMPKELKLRAMER